MPRRPVYTLYGGARADVKYANGEVTRSRSGTKTDSLKKPQNMQFRTFPATERRFEQLSSAAAAQPLQVFYQNHFVPRFVVHQLGDHLLRHYDSQPARPQTFFFPRSRVRQRVVFRIVYGGVV